VRGEPRCVFIGVAAAACWPRREDRHDRLGRRRGHAKGATELERIADVTSRPWIEERQACAVAYQGRLACFEILRGTPT